MLRGSNHLVLNPESLFHISFTLSYLFPAWIVQVFSIEYVTFTLLINVFENTVSNWDIGIPSIHETVQVEHTKAKYI